MAQPQVDVGVMTQTLEAVLGVFEAGAGNLVSGGSGLLSTLIAIEIVWGGIMWAFMDATPAFKQFLRKIVFVGVFAFIVLNWVTLANTILDGFIWAGAEIGGGQVPIDLVRDPSRVLELGLSATGTIWEEVGDMSIMNSDWLAIVMMALVGLVTLSLYFVIAMMVYMTLLEFYIVSAFGAIFIPWGVNKHTKWIAERYFGAIVAQGTKLMVLSALIAVVYPILQGLELPPDPSWMDTLSLAFGAATIAFVTWKAPSVAGGLMSGSASLQAAEAMGQAQVAGGAAATAVGAAATTAGSGGAAGPAGAAATAGSVKSAASMSADGSLGGGGSATKSGSSLSD